MDEELLREVGRRFKRVVTIEDGIVRGGVGEAIAAFMLREGFTPEITNLGIEDRFVEQGKPAELYAECGYDEEALVRLLEQ